MTAPPRTEAEFWALPVIENRGSLVYIKAEGACVACRGDSGDWWGLEIDDAGTWARTIMAGPPFP